MWNLEVRGERGTPFTELGTYASLTDAARVILQREGNPYGSLFFRLYVDPDSGLPNRDTDAEILSCLHYQGKKHFYKLWRNSH